MEVASYSFSLPLSINSQSHFNSIFTQLDFSGLKTQRITMEHSFSVLHGCKCGRADWLLRLSEVATLRDVTHWFVKGRFWLGLWRACHCHLVFFGARRNHIWTCGRSWWSNTGQASVRRVNQIDTNRHLTFLSGSLRPSGLCSL